MAPFSFREARPGKCAPPGKGTGGGADAKLAPTNAPKGWSIGIAASRDLLHWEKVGELRPEQECDRNGLCAPGAVVLDGQVHLFYQTYGNGPRDALCHAVARDGLHFTRDASNPVFRPTGDWTAGRAIDADAIPFGDRLLLFFATRDPAMKVQMLGVAEAIQGNNDKGKTWFLPAVELGWQNQAPFAMWDSPKFPAQPHAPR